MNKAKPTQIQLHWRAYFALILILGAIWIFLTAALVPVNNQAQATAPRAGFYAPEFELTALTGQTSRLSDLVGKAVIINFWTSWCAPCQAEMPVLQSVYERFSEQGLIILAVNSTTQDDPGSASAFVTSRGLTFPILMDSSGVVTKQYQVRAFPTTYFVDRTGRIRDFAVGGPLNEAYLNAQVESLLAGVH